MCLYPAQAKLQGQGRLCTVSEIGHIYSWHANLREPENPSKSTSRE